MAVINDPTKPKTFTPSLGPITESKPYTPVVTEPKPGVLGDAPELITGASPTYDYTQKTIDQAGVAGTGKTSRYISPEATVQYQLEQILEGDTPYVELAKSKAQEEAQRAGLLSSSMAIGAAQRAAIETALPVAQQTAKAYETSDLATQEQIGRSVLQAQGAEEGRTLERQRFAEETALTQQKAYENLKALRMQGEINFSIEKLGQAAQDRRLEYETTIKADLENARISTEIRQQFMASVDDLGAQYSSDLSAVLRDPNFQNSTERKTAQDVLYREYQASVDFLRSATAVDMNWDGVPTMEATKPTATISGTTLDGTGIVEGSIDPRFGTDITTVDESGNPTYTVDQIANKQVVQDASVGTYYESLAQNTYDNFNDFDSDLVGSGAIQTDEYFNFTKIPFNETQSIVSGGSGYDETTTEQSEIPLNLTDGEKWEVYSKIMYAALNPENTQAREEAVGIATRPVMSNIGVYDQMQGTGEMSSILPYADIEALPPSERELPLYQQWINDNLY